MRSITGAKSVARSSGTKGRPGGIFLLAAFCICPALTALELPTVQIARQSNQVVLTFTGKLMTANALAGPWTEITNAVSPSTQPALGERKFFRSSAPSIVSIFSARTVLDLALAAPLQTHFDKAFAGVPDGIVPPRREKPYFDGVAKLAGLEIPVTLRVRGNSSLQECPFPKLKLKVSKEHRAGTPFSDAREIKIGTHCADGGRGTIGRLRDQRATFREALAYETMDLLGFISPRVRRASLEFRDTSPANAPNPGGWLVDREALIFDDVEVVAERLGGAALNDEEILVLKDANFSEQLIVDLHFLHALLGNWDYRLSIDGQNLWNTDVIRLADGKLVPLAGDFDLSSWVTERVRSTAPREYHPELPDLDREARYRLENLKQTIKPDLFSAAQNRFTSKRSGIEAQIAQAEVDEPGRTNAVNHVKSFFDALAIVATGRN